MEGKALILLRSHTEGTTTFHSPATLQANDASVMIFKRTSVKKKHVDSDFINTLHAIQLTSQWLPLTNKQCTGKKSLLITGRSYISNYIFFIFENVCDKKIPNRYRSRLGHPTIALSSANSRYVIMFTVFRHQYLAIKLDLLF